MHRRPNQISICAALLAAIVIATTARAADLRQRLNFNRDWRFVLGDKPGAAAVDFDDRAWDSINLPHSFSMPYFLADDFYQGYGWYRKHFDVPPEDDGKRVFLEFEAAFQDAEVFVNGQRVIEHKGGYTGFSIDITDVIKPGSNLVAVRLNNLWNARLAPRAGEHTFSGGIYRNVYLVITDPLHVTWYGTFVKTPKVSKESALVSVDTEVRNDTRALKHATVEAQIIDAQGKRVMTMRSPQEISAGATITVHQISQTIADPRLWSPQQPNLYSVHTIILDGGQPVDTFDSPLGFRWFAFTPDKGFFLNGEHYYFHGANVHQDHAGWGDAVADSGFARDVKLVKDAGFDFIRGSHYPHAPAFADACDRTGVLFWSENNFWGSGGLGREGNFRTSGSYPSHVEDEADFNQSVKNSLRDMIRIHRNHPSIIVWSMCNEPFFTQKSTLPQVRALLSEVVKESHELDPTRPVAIGGCQRGDIDKLGDIAGYNGDGARLFINPGIASVVSEYGSTTALRPGKYAPGWGDLPTGRGQDKSEPYPWRYAWRSGEAIWCAFDHGSVAGERLGRMGIIDYFRIPKRSWYWYRNEYAKIPPPQWPQPGTPAKLLLSADKTSINHADGTDDVQLMVTVTDAAGKPISNSPPVAFDIVSGPGEFPTGRSIQFANDSDINILDGQAAIEFRSYYAGKSVIRATSPGLVSSEITITTTGGPAYVAGVTPDVKPRPYVRFTKAGESTETVFGRDNPTRASSEAPNHSGKLANDGDLATYWQNANGDKSPWWMLDMERGVKVSSVKITFPEPGEYHYKIEVSDDLQRWKMSADFSENKQVQSSQKIGLKPAAVGRYIRVTFTDQPANPVNRISEFEATGRVVYK
jgi:beta-galactosidase